MIFVLFFCFFFFKSTTKLPLLERFAWNVAWEEWRSIIQSERVKRIRNGKLLCPFAVLFAIRIERATKKVPGDFVTVPDSARYLERRREEEYWWIERWNVCEDVARDRSKGRRRQRRNRGSILTRDQRNFSFDLDAKKIVIRCYFSITSGRN